MNEINIHYSMASQIIYSMASQLDYESTFPPGKVHPEFLSYDVDYWWDKFCAADDWCLSFDSTGCIDSPL